ncbi:MAG: DUF1800 domain-containing protein, partial [Planctomycetota bacterium]|nr:DUF1800 domain-containing protein [Planctomycetota bacterium]
FPDENYAREIMQLFSIGLYELRPDGTQRLDGRGQPIPTYTNEDITEFAKIFTGLSYASPDGSFSDGTPVWTTPMRMYDEFHEPGTKQLLRGFQVPAGQTGLQDLADAVDNLFNHPNVGPFFGRRMIQRLVTSNPHPHYVERVAAVFADNGNGVRGDLEAVLRAILLDPEARTSPDDAEVERGMLRESFLRRVHLARAFNASNYSFDYPISDFGADETFGQRPLSSPTVFNFFLPDYAPLGEIADAGIVAPEFQIVNAVTAITSSNELRRQVDGSMNGGRMGVRTVTLDLAAEIAIASDARALIERLNLLLMQGDMSIPMKSILLRALSQTPDLETRVQMAVHLITLSPEYNVLR